MGWLCVLTPQHITTQAWLPFLLPLSPAWLPTGRGKKGRRGEVLVGSHAWHFGSVPIVLLQLLQAPPLLPPLAAVASHWALLAAHTATPGANLPPPPPPHTPLPVTAPALQLYTIIETLSVPILLPCFQPLLCWWSDTDRKKWCRQRPVYLSYWSWCDTDVGLTHLHENKCSITSKRWSSWIWFAKQWLADGYTNLWFDESFILKGL